MGFGNAFISWIRLLHTEAKTRFILANLTDLIFVSFSIRQGDPLAMFLYIIYIEPLLMYVEKRVTGLQGPLSLATRSLVSNNLCGGTTEAYCDDVNVHNFK